MLRNLQFFLLALLFVLFCEAIYIALSAAIHGPGLTLYFIKMTSQFYSYSPTTRYVLGILFAAGTFFSAMVFTLAFHIVEKAKA